MGLLHHRCKAEMVVAVVDAAEAEAEAMDAVDISPTKGKSNS